MLVFETGIQFAGEGDAAMDLLYRIIAFYIMIVVSLTGFSGHGKNTTYYFDSVNGSDTNTGLSESKPLKSVALMNSLMLKSGDTVLIKSGSVYREKLTCQKGVRYSSYGEGEKPLIMPSVDASGSQKWKKTDYENVWKFTKTIGKDAGNIIFNDGEATGIKIAAEINGYKGRTDELKNDLEFFHGKDGYVYLFSTENPGERFSSIEIAYRTYGITPVSGVTIDGLAVLYAGSHGIGASESDNITIRNCDVGFCGGSLQYEGTRFGNGIQFWEGGNNILVENCYVYQIYDAGLTFQAKEGIFRNVTFRNNVVDKCTYSIEYFTHGDGYFENILIDSNYLKNAGYGWGKQRPDPVHTSHINSWYSIENRARNFVVSNNILQCSTHALFNIGSLAGTPPVFTGNTYRQPHSGYMFSNHSNFYTDKAFEVMSQMDPTGKMEKWYGGTE